MRHQLNKPLALVVDLRYDGLLGGRHDGPLLRTAHATVEGGVINTGYNLTRMRLLGRTQPSYSSNYEAFALMRYCICERQEKSSREDYRGWFNFRHISSDGRTHRLFRFESKLRGGVVISYIRPLGGLILRNDWETIQTMSKVDCAKVLGFEI